MSDDPTVDNRNDPALDVRAYQLDDDEVRRQLDRLAKLCARICEAPIALVSLVFEDSQLFVGKSGVDLEGTPRAYSFCAHAMLGGGLMTVPDARADPRFADNPLVTGAPHIRFYAGQPLISPDGTPLGSFCVIDSQPRSRLSIDQAEALETLAEAAMALLEKWRQAKEHRHQNSTTRARLAHLELRFDVLVDALPQLVWSATPDGSCDYFSAPWAKFTGQPVAAGLGTRWMDFVHPDDIADSCAAWNDAVANGSSFTRNSRLRRHDGEYVWMLARGLPICDADGAIVRWIGTCTDIQGQVQAGELLEIMSQELNHRIKNLFAVTQGLISMTLRNHPTLKPVAGEMQARLRALGRAHDLVRPRFVSPQFSSSIGHRDPSLHQMLNTLLMPYSSDEQPRWRIAGRDVAVNEQAATPLALFVHEMSTNSVKYGALSAAGGYVAITVAAGPGPDPRQDGNAAAGEQIDICWSEHGGPRVFEPASRGFGYRLVELSIVRQLGGVLEFAWLPAGLVVTATVPLLAISGIASRQAASSMPDSAK